MMAEKSRTLKSAAPATITQLLGCQSIDKMVERIGLRMCLLTHQLLSFSKLQIEMHRAPEATANLFSAGLHLTNVAARLIRRITSVGCHSLPTRFHTYAFRSCEQVTKRFEFGAQSMPVTSFSCSRRTWTSLNWPASFLKTCTSLLLGHKAISMKATINTEVRSKQAQTYEYDPYSTHGR